VFGNRKLCHHSATPSRNRYLRGEHIDPAVYAAGDAAATEGPPLTPVASYEGLIVATNY
jgi:glutathione reductase (NADPH)